MRRGTKHRVSALVVDANEEDRDLISSSLERSGIRVTTVEDGREALDRLRDVPFELLVVDLDLSGSVDGFRVAKDAHWRWPKTALVLTTRHPSVDSAVNGIDLGIDGYLIKPASTEAIRERAETALERQRLRCCVAEERDLLEFRGLSLDKEGQRVTVRGEEVHLTPTEFTLLLHLMENARRVLSPQELAREARGERRSVKEAADLVRWHIHNLRHKIEADPSHPRYVVNVHGAGYTFGEPD